MTDLDIPADLHYREIPAEPEHLSEIRHILTQRATSIGIAAERVQDLALAAYEAMVNVMAHAYRDQLGVFELHAIYLSEHQQVTITVIDYGCWRSPKLGGSAIRDGGRGLPLIRALTDNATITADTDGTRVRM